MNADLVVALSPVFAVLRALGVRHYVGGSIASSAHGIARASIDADIVAELLPAHGRAICEGLESEYYVPEGRVHDAISRRASFNIIHLATMLKIDIFVAKDRPFERRAMERICHEPEVAGSEGHFPVASAEDVVLAELEWFRPGGEASERQWADVLGVLRASASRLSWSFLDQGAEELGVRDLLDRAISQVGKG